MKLAKEDFRLGKGFLEHLPLDKVLVDDDASDLDPVRIAPIEEVENASHRVSSFVEGNEINHRDSSTR